MNYETVERCGRIHVVKNGVESAEFIMPSFDGYRIFAPEPWEEFKTLDGAIEGIASLIMDDWYTVKEAAVRLVELGAVDKPPHPKTVCRWARAGRFPGAVRVGPGRGGGWRLPEKSLREFKKGGKR